MMPQTWEFGIARKAAGSAASRVKGPDAAVDGAFAALGLKSQSQEQCIFRIDPYGVPVYMVERKREDDGPVYYKGKGYSDRESLASGLMETVERISAERFEGPVVRGTHSELENRGENAVNPMDLHALTLKAWSPPTAVPWAQGYDLLGKRASYAPLNLVVTPYSGAEFFRSNSVGLGAGFTYEEAVCHALCEVMEHDALCMANLFNPNSWRFEILPQPGQAGSATIQPSAPDTTPELLFPLLRIDSFPEKALRVARALQNAGLMVFARNISNDMDVPAVSCVLAETVHDGSCRVYLGHGAHTDAEHALVRALCEAAQSHCVSRWMVENGKMKSIPETTGDPERLYGYGRSGDFSEMHSSCFHTIDEEIRFLLKRIESCGLEHALAFDLTKKKIGLPVVRVIVPGAEYLVMETSQQILGPRAQKLLEFRKAAFLNALNIQQQISS
jgi:ribosomal protein S12 methylthiotransferase accessory factor